MPATKEFQGQFVIDFSPASRNSDPATSKKAEKKITESGGRISHCQIILAMLKKRNGSTSPELAGFLRGTLTEPQIHKRRNDLIENGYIEIKGIRNGFGIWWVV